MSKTPFRDLDDAARMRGIAFLEASLAEERQAKRRPLKLAAASTRRVDRLGSKPNKRAA
jgi:hypothetical protein